jgi:hypothetical protein
MIDSTDYPFMVDKGVPHDICSRGLTEGGWEPKDQEEGTEAPLYEPFFSQNIS